MSTYVHHVECFTFRPHHDPRRQVCLGSLTQRVADQASRSGQAPSRPADPSWVFLSICLPRVPAVSHLGENSLCLGHLSFHPAEAEPHCSQNLKGSFHFWLCPAGKPRAVKGEQEPPRSGVVTQSLGALCWGQACGGVCDSGGSDPCCPSSGAAFLCVCSAVLILGPERLRPRGFARSVLVPSPSPLHRTPGQVAVRATHWDIGVLGVPGS